MHGTKGQDRKFLAMVQKRAARVAVGASTVRGQGPGVAACGRAFLARLDLAQFGTQNREVYARHLERVTKRLVANLPKQAATWGLARKLLNIFLRDCLYTIYLNLAYRLDAAEASMEIPLDSVTAKALRSAVPGLTGWPGVKHLTPDQSAAYQLAAEAVALKAGVARVHLDAYWWADRA